MDNLFKSISAIQSRLDEAGISTIVIGGVAVGAWGEPRLTRDVDLKVSIGRNEADRLVEELSPDFKSLLPDPLSALRQQAMVFIEDQFGTRIDLLLADTSFDVSAIQRGYDIEVQPGLLIRICSPEDLIIYKLVSTRQRDHEDVKGIVRRQGDSLDEKYILHWLDQFEQALDDSTLINEFLDLRRRSSTADKH